MVSWLCCCTECDCPTFPESTTWEDCIPDDANYSQFYPGTEPMGWDPQFLRSGGYLQCFDDSFPSANDDVICTRTYTKPTGSGHVIEVGVSILANGDGSSTIGLYVGDDTTFANRLVRLFMVFNQTPDNNQLKVEYNAGFASDVKTGIDTGAGTPVAHDLKVVMTDAGSSTYDVGLYLDGTLEQTDSGQSITVPSSFDAGFFCTDRANWNCHYVKLTAGS